jgi:peptide chain release factor 2
MKMLLGLLYEHHRTAKEAEFEKTYTSDKMENGFGSQIRTWTLTPYQMVKDERTGFKANNVTEVLDGDLDQLIESYLLWAANPKQ